MSRHHFSVIVTVLTLSFGTLPAFAAPGMQSQPSFGQPASEMLAQNQRGPRGDGPGWENRRDRKDRMMEALNLTQEQQQQMQSIKDKYSAQMKERHERMRTEHEALRTMMSGNASTATIRAKHQQISTLRQELEELRFNSMMEMREVLTPAQRQQFAQMMDKKRGDRPNRRGGGDEMTPNGN